MSNLSGILGEQPIVSMTDTPGCGIDTEADWGGVAAYFEEGAFVGYSISSGSGQLATTEGLETGQALAEAQSIYGSALHTSLAQGGDWHVNTVSGELSGFLTNSPPIDAESTISTIEAGELGCAAARP
jgi:hypothetical protein